MARYAKEEKKEKKSFGSEFNWIEGRLTDWYKVRKISPNLPPFPPSVLCANWLSSMCVCLGGGGGRRYDVY